MSINDFEQITCLRSVAASQSQPDRAERPSARVLPLNSASSRHSMPVVLAKLPKRACVHACSLHAVSRERDPFSRAAPRILHDANRRSDIYGGAVVFSRWISTHRLVDCEISMKHDEYPARPARNRRRSDTLPLWKLLICPWISR